MKIIRALIRAVDKINTWVGGTCAFLIFPLLGVSMYEVISRYLFNRPTIWASQILSIIFVIMVVLGGGYVLLNDGHVRMDMLYSRLSPKHRATTDVATFVVFLLFTILLAWQATEMAWESVKIREASWSAFKAPIYPKKIALALAMYLLFLQGMVKLIRNISFIRGKRVKRDNNGN